MYLKGFQPNLVLSLVFSRKHHFKVLALSFKMEVSKHGLKSNTAIGRQSITHLLVCSKCKPQKGELLEKTKTIS
eukprot:snap_masked-scaffold_6-processed-gene-20.41-mRNA-1 protein AED:1.00 eAED:1.00 QI:0/0/0/0/1/1/2/0/73